MKFSTTAIILAIAATTSNAFVAPNAHRSSFVTTASNRQYNNVLRMSEDAMSEVEKLRAAAAKAREEAAKLSKELGKDVDEVGTVATAAPVAKESVSSQDIMALTSSIDFEGGDASSQSEKLDSLVEAGDLTMWKQALSGTSLRTYPVSLNFLESRSNGKITADALGFGGEDDVSMDDFKYATLGVTLGASVLGVLALAFLPENIGAAVCYAMALIPIAFIGIGSSAPGIIAGAIKTAKGTADTEDERLDRICRHEAGHFLCGYMSGLPIKEYTATDNGVQCVEFHPSQEGPVTGREFSSEEIAALSCVAMSGSVAEILGLGDAKGGENDLLLLDGFFRRSKDFIGAQKQQELTRWGALASYNLINDNASKFDELVEAFKTQKSVPECIAILESR